MRLFNSKKTIVFFCLLIGWYGIIFYFSAQPAELSGELSRPIADKLADATNAKEKVEAEGIQKNEHPLSIEVDVTAEINKYEQFMRKSAHIFLFFGIGALSALAFQRIHMLFWKQILCTMFVSLLFAVFDEFHQIFVPGRACLWTDIGIDFLGSLAGILLVLSFFAIRKRILVRNRK